LGWDERIAAFESDRRHASHELVLYQEHFPYVLDSWLRQNPNRTAEMLESLFATIDFLGGSRERSTLTLTLENVVTDGDAPISDGLLAWRWAKIFRLSDEEADFLDKHRDTTTHDSTPACLSTWTTATEPCLRQPAASPEGEISDWRRRTPRA